MGCYRYNTDNGSFHSLEQIDQGFLGHLLRHVRLDDFTTLLIQDIPGFGRGAPKGTSGNQDLITHFDALCTTVTSLCASAVIAAQSPRETAFLSTRLPPTATTTAPA